MARLDAIDRHGTQKLYCQLAELLRAHVESGRWAVGAQVPSEEQLCRAYDVSKATVRLAVEELVSLGVLKKLQGKGTFVRRRKPEHAIPLLTNLADDETCRNPSCLARLIDYRVLRPDEEVRAHLKLGEDDNCHRFVVSTVKLGSPWLLQRTWVPYALLPSALGGDEVERVCREGPYAFVDGRCGLRIDRLREALDVVPAGDEDGPLLGVEAAEALLRASRLCTAADGTPVAFSRSLYRTTTEARTTELERLTP